MKVVKSGKTSFPSKSLHLAFVHLKNITEVKRWLAVNSDRIPEVDDGAWFILTSYEGGSRSQFRKWIIYPNN